MTQLLIKKFIKDYEHTDDNKVREGYGILSSFVGIACNILLFLLKLIIGLMTRSIAIISDAFNNLSDCASCVITLFGYKLAAKPADKDHPFGHGRIEYLTSLVIAAIIAIVGFELFKESVNKIIHPDLIMFSYIAVAILIVSMIIKFWMFRFNKKLGETINNQIMVATSKDSLSDVMATGATLIALLASLFTTFPMDGVMGIIVSIMILISAYGIFSDTAGKLIGQPEDKETVKKITNIIMSHKEPLGVHDMIIHSYGPGMSIGSCHVEVDAASDFMTAHDVIDDIERDIENELHIMMTIHMDPVVKDDEQTRKYKAMVVHILRDIKDDFSVHDFRVVPGPNHTNLVFDVLVPYDIDISDEEIKTILERELAKEKIKFYTVINFDHPFV